MKNFEEYIKNFNYKSISKISINAKDFLEQISEGNFQAIDIRFKEEYDMWHNGIFKNIPMNELSERLDELDKNKQIILACPYNTRSNIAAHYLMLKGYDVKFLSDGLTGLNTMLLGGVAKKVSLSLQKSKY